MNTLKFEEMEFKSGNKNLVVVLDEKMQLVSTLLMSDIQSNYPEYVLSSIDNVLNGNSDLEVLNLNICSLEIGKDTTKIYKNTDSDEESICKIDTKDLKNNINTWHDKISEYNTKNKTTPNTPLVKSSATYDMKSIDDLKNVENFNYSALSHIFIGQVKKKNRVSGFHYENFPGTLGKVIEDTRSPEDKFGVYTAHVTISNIPKRVPSSFYPKILNPQEVIDNINYAYSNKVQVPGAEAGTYRGETQNQMVIEMFLSTSNDKIISAFPIY